MATQSKGDGVTRDRGMGRIYLRGTNWWIQYNHRGHLFREPARSQERSAAVKLLRRRLGEIGQGKHVGQDVEKTTFEQLAAMLVDDYKLNGRKSLDRAELSIKHLKRTFARNLAIEITHDRVAAYLRRRLEHVKPATARLELCALKRMFKLGHRAGKVAMMPAFPSLSINNARTGFFEPNQLRAVLAELPGHLRPLVQFLAFTGWRVSEATSLRWAQVDFAGGVVRLEVGTTKTGAGRIFPYAALPQLAAIIHEQRETTTALERDRGIICPWVFNRYGREIRSFHYAWREACKRARVPDRLVHDLRRTAARNLVRSGVPERTAMALMGHKTRSIFDRYNIVSEADLADGVRRLAAFQHSKSADDADSLAAKAQDGGR